jgi:hypothetical protein
MPYRMGKIMIAIPEFAAGMIVGAVLIVCGQLAPLQVL